MNQEDDPLRAIEPKIFVVGLNHGYASYNCSSILDFLGHVQDYELELRPN
jgi:hypothetical protein